VEDDRTSDVLLQLLVDLPDQLLALLDIRFLRLLVEQLLDVLVAVVGVVALGAAGIVFVERLVGIVDRVAGQVKAKVVILARPAARAKITRISANSPGSVSTSIEPP
jgi:hypothetical protein